MLQEIFNGTGVAETTESEAINIDHIKDNFAVQAVWANGNSNDHDLSLKVSNDGTNYEEVADTSTNVTSASGTKIWDNLTSAAKYLKFVVARTTGSLDVVATVNSKASRTQLF